MNEYLATTPFDIYELSLFQLVVRQESFTKAAQIAGLTQSAMTRQMQGMENSLGLELLERTTRRVRATPAGEFLFRESARLVGDVERMLRELREGFGGARKEVRIGVSRSIGPAYLPGFLHANLRKLPEVSCRVSCDRNAGILAALEAGELDLGVICPPKRLARTLRVTHRFDDAFTLLAPRQPETAFHEAAKRPKPLKDWLAKQNWLMLEEDSNTGRRLRAWMKQNGWLVEPAMQFDGFDPIINLVALGMGVSFVPIRALALYGRKQTLRRVPMKARFVRELVVVMRRQRKTPEHLRQFVENVLF